MTLSRPALIAILGGVLILAVFAVTRAAGQADDGEAAAPPAAATAEPAQSAATEEPAATDEPAPAKEAEAGVPAGLERAIARGQVAVLAFTQKGGSEDAAVRSAVDSLSGVPVFVDDVGDIADYGQVVGELDIDRAPAVVIVRADGKAEVVEGYVDPGSLAQQVEDAR